MKFTNLPCAIAAGALARPDGEHEPAAPVGSASRCGGGVVLEVALRSRSLCVLAEALTPCVRNRFSTKVYGLHPSPHDRNWSTLVPLRSTLHTLATGLKLDVSAHKSGRASVGLHTEMYFANNPTEEDAFVLAVDKSKISVIVPRFGIEGTVRAAYYLGCTNYT